MDCLYISHDSHHGLFQPMNRTGLGFGAFSFGLKRAAECSAVVIQAVVVHDSKTSALETKW